jgi:hypothetical protein
MILLVNDVFILEEQIFSCCFSAHSMIKGNNEVTNAQ